MGGIVEYKSLEDVGKEFVEILKKNNSKCSYKDITVGDTILRDIDCILRNKRRLSILYYRDTGEIFEVIDIKKLSKWEN